MARKLTYDSAVVEVRGWSPVAVWHWGGDQLEKCAICQNLIMHRCIECQANQAAEDCKVAWGTCDHVFHFHCINRWRKTRNVCPMDNLPWEFRQVSETSS